MQASVAELKTNLSKVLSRGETGLVRKHNKPVAKMIPVTKRRTNQTQIGCAVGTDKTRGDLMELLIPEED